MTWVLLGLASLMATELLFSLPVLSHFKKAADASQKSVRLISNKAVSDHWKEAVLPRYAGQLGGSSLMGLLFLGLALLPFGLFILFNSGTVADDLAFLASLPAIAVMLAVSVGYVVLRNRAPQSASGYSWTDQMLHRTALGSVAVAEMSFDLERARHLKTAPDPSPRRHVFVTGLARAGTTVLLRELYTSGQFAALTYRDMPFVLAPNTWSALSRKRAVAKAERAHGDGIEVDLESPEALDEVLWRVFEGDRYIGQDHLSPHEPEPETLSAYGDLMRLVMKRGQAERYLSKNNNNILRIPALANAFPDAVFLIPVRDPLQHANSLLEQHKRFTGSDGFTKNYMRWLGHQEFGETHRPFRFDNEAVSGDPAELDYWLKRWISAHAYLGRVAKAYPGQVLFVSSEALTGDPEAWTALCARLELDATPLTELKSVGKREVPHHSADLACEAYAIFETLPLGD